MTLLTTRLGQWILGMAALVALLGVLTAVGLLAPVEEAASTVFGPVQRVIRQATEPVADLVRNIDDFDRAQDENRALRSRIEQLEAELVRLREEQIAVRGREALLAVQAEFADQIFVTAEVITRDLTGLRDIIGINKGSNDGLQVGMPVLAEGGSLVGVVSAVRGDTAFVRLITDPDSSVRILHQRSREEGVLSGDTLGNLNVTFIPQATDIQPGHLFVTSGLDGKLPKGLPVGRVASAQGSAQEVFKRIRLTALAPLDELETLLIQVTFTPTDASLPTDAELEAEQAAGTNPGGAASENGEASP